MHQLIRRLWGRFSAHLDPFLTWVALALMVVGSMTVYSATYVGNSRLLPEMVNLLSAFLLMWFVARMPPQTLMRFGIPLYVLGLILLVGVWVAGVKVNGAKRWLSIGVTRIQPSEIMKIAMPLMLAWYYQCYETTRNWRQHVVAAILLLVPVALIAKQPDLGTAILVAAAGFYVIFLAGLPWKVILAMLAAAGAAAPLIWNVLHDYQRKRILTLLDPSSDPLGAGYHIIQSTIAIGSGGIFGKGWLNGTQTHLEFIPEKHTDFIFAVFSEEWGLIGNLVLVMLYLLLIGRAMVIAANAPTLFTRLLGGSITLIFFTYAFVNMGMVSGILPVVGVPLPFISYGGTALVTLFLGLGILMSIQTHRMLVKK